MVDPWWCSHAPAERTLHRHLETQRPAVPATCDRWRGLHHARRPTKTTLAGISTREADKYGKSGPLGHNGREDRKNSHAVMTLRIRVTTALYPQDMQHRMLALTIALLAITGCVGRTTPPARR